MKLIEPTMEYEKQIQQYRQEFLDLGDSMDGTSSLRHFDNSAEWIEKCEKGKYTENVEPGYAPSTQFIFVREDDEKIVGMLDIRHFFTPYLEKFAGNIGYSVAPSERRKGYATKMLKAALPECRKLGLKKVLITCNDDNEGSRKTILNNGGVYESTVYEDEREHGYLERYWIDLKNIRE